MHGKNLADLYGIIIIIILYWGNLICALLDIARHVVVTTAYCGCQVS